MPQAAVVSALSPRLRLLGRDSPPSRETGRSGRADPARRAAPDEFRVALCLPLQGSDGIWGPSCLASARLAQDEINLWHGIAGRPCAVRLVDASEAAVDVGRDIADLVDGGEIDAIVGMCISSVRERITGELAGRTPFVYTPLYEGGELPAGVYAIGETAARQLRPSLAWLGARHAIGRWALVGNDYVWPRVSHRIARKAIAALGGEVVAERFLPFGVDDFGPVLDELRAARADAVLLSMVGQDAVDFNRAFGRAGLARRMLRLSCAIEENQLLAIGADNTERLFVALGYFAGLQTEANLAFKERYHARFGDRAPALNSIGQSLYEGMHFLAALMEDRPEFAGRLYPSAREAVWRGGGANEAPIYLAEAEGHGFRVITRL
jgi:ABC-type branched-subunit amino acid transport system substrate-binding protein